MRKVVPLALEKKHETAADCWIVEGLWDCPLLFLRCSFPGTADLD